MGVCEWQGDEEHGGCVWLNDVRCYDARFGIRSRKRERKEVEPTENVCESLVLSAACSL